jgi:hypothetical protein
MVYRIKLSYPGLSRPYLTAVDLVWIKKPDIPQSIDKI